MILRSPRKLLVVMMALVLIAAWGITAAVVTGDRRRVYETADAELIGAIPVLRMHARRSFDAAYAILVAVDEALQVEGRHFTPSQLRMLAHRMQPDDNPLGIATIDDNEKLLRTESEGEVDVSDREYMIAIRNAPPGTYFIGKTLPSRISGRAVIPMVMRMRPNSHGIKAVLAAVPTSGFEESYRDLLVSAPAAIGLLRHDSTVLHLTPDPRQRIGKLLPGYDLATLKRDYQPHSVFDQDKSEDFGMRLKVSYAEVESYPLVVIAAMREDALQAAWWGQAWPKLAGMTLGTVVILLLTAWLFVLMMRRDAALKRVTEALVELDKANSAKRDFLARMSHELRTPLNAIIGFSEMISGAIVGPLAKTYQDYGRDIHRSGEHLLAMINQVLDITRIESGALTLQEAPVDVGQVAAEVQDILRNLTGMRNVTMQCKIDPAARRLLADPMMLRQMMLNLLSNAVKASPAGTTVEFLADVVESGIMLRVVDQGAGIRPEKLAQIFEPFGSGQSMLADQSSGIGLGLPITRKLIEMHGGTLTLASGQQGGTVATLTFPLARRIAA